MQPLKVVHLIDSLRIGGAEKLLVDTIEILNDRSTVESTVAVLYGGGIWEQDIEGFGSRVRDLGLKGYPGFFLGALRLGTMLKSAAPDLVHVHLFPANWMVGLAGLSGLFRGPIVATEHNTTNKRRRYPLLRYLEAIFYSRMDSVICVSDDVRQNLTSWLPSISSRCVTINNGVPIPRSQWTAGEHQDFDFVSISSLIPQKGLEILIDAVNLLKTRGYGGVRLGLAGEGPLRDQLKGRVRALGLTDNILFLGSVKDTEALRLRSGAFVASSLWEGLSISLLEAMAQGMPIISTTVSGASEALDDNRSALLVPASDAAEFANAMEKLLTDAPFSAALAKQARATAVNRFNIDHYVASLMNVYRSVLGSRE